MDAAAQEIDIGPHDAPGAAITIANRRYFLIRRDGGHFLLSATCPHMGGEVVDTGDRFECPLHGWRFDRQTGRCLNAPGAALSEVPVVVRNDRLFAQIPTRAFAPAPSAPVGVAVDLSVTLVAHACLQIVHRGFTLLTDPWLNGPAMFGAWTQHPPAVMAMEDLRPDAIWISHEHSDHFHESTLAGFDRSIPIYFPDFPNRRIPARLAAMGFRNALPMPFGDTLEIAQGLRLTCYEPASLWNDALVLIDANGFRLLNLNDAGLNRRIARLLGPVDAVASAFTPGASGYPLTWKHLSDEAQNAVLDRSREGMLQMLREAVKLYGCRYLLPFAGHFALWHPLHQHYSQRMCKNTLADVKAALADVPVKVIDLLPGECWDAQIGTISRVWSHRCEPFQRAVFNEPAGHPFDANAFAREHPVATEPLSPGEVDAHFLRLNDVPEMIFCDDLRVRLCVTSLGFDEVIFERSYEIAGGRLAIARDDLAPANVTIEVPQAIVAKIVRDQASWDEAHIGYWCRFSRLPDVYHGGFWRLLQSPYYRRAVGSAPIAIGPQITPQTNIGELVERFSDEAERILRRYGLYCGGCHRASAESIAQGAAAHGVDASQVDRLVAELNSALNFTP